MGYAVEREEPCDTTSGLTVIDGTTPTIRILSDNFGCSIAACWSNRCGIGSSVAEAVGKLFAYESETAAVEIGAQILTSLSHEGKPFRFEFVNAS